MTEEIRNYITISTHLVAFHEQQKRELSDIERVKFRKDLEHMIIINTLIFTANDIMEHDSLLDHIDYLIEIYTKILLG